MRGHGTVRFCKNCGKIHITEFPISATFPRQCSGLGHSHPAMQLSPPLSARTLSSSQRETAPAKQLPSHVPAPGTPPSCLDCSGSPPSGIYRVRSAAGLPDQRLVLQAGPHVARVHAVEPGPYQGRAGSPRRPQEWRVDGGGRGEPAAAVTTVQQQIDVSRPTAGGREGF